MMLVGPMKKRLVTTVVVVVIVLTLIFGALGFVIVSAKNKEIADWEAKLGKETARLVFAENFPAGHIIDRGDLIEAVIKDESTPADSYEGTTTVTQENREEIYLMTGTNYKPGERVPTLNILAGRTLKIDVSAKTPLTEKMLVELDEIPSDDLRLEEFTMINLPSDTVDGEYIDVRVMFPTGEDFTVLIGKKVEKFTDSSIFLSLTEDEILTMGSAIVEAYMYEGTKIYATKYIDPSNQLYKHEKVDYVAKYKEGIEALKEAKEAEKLQELLIKLNEENPEEYARLETLKLEDEEKYKAEILIAYGDEIKVNTEDITIEEIANHINLTEYGTEEIKAALEKDDKNVIEKYENKIVTSKKQIARTYPVKEEVLMVINTNPNILEEIKAEFALTAELSSQVQKFDPLLYDSAEAYEKYVSSVKDEIQVQKDERVKYLKSLIAE